MRCSDGTFSSGWSNFWQYEQSQGVQQLVYVADCFVYMVTKDAPAPDSSDQILIFSTGNSA
jgi:hypothetical protein